MVFITMASGMAPFRRQTELDKICFETRSVLCVNSTLMSIRKAVIHVENIANDIEKGINKSSLNFGKLYEVVEDEIELTRSILPKTAFYDKSSTQSNIDKVDFFFWLILRKLFDFFLGIIWSVSERNALCYDFLLQFD